MTDRLKEIEDRLRDTTMLSMRLTPAESCWLIDEVRRLRALCHDLGIDDIVFQKGVGVEFEFEAKLKEGVTMTGHRQKEKDDG